MKNLEQIRAANALEPAKDASRRDSRHLQRATAEALAYLSYLKRFGPDIPSRHDVRS